MKNLLIFLVTMVSMTSHASSYVDDLKRLSWTELKDHYEVDFEGDQINFSGTFISRLDLCLSDSETLRTIEKREIEEFDGDDFVVVGYDYLYQTLNYSKTYVDGDGTIDILKRYELSKEIKVVQNDSDFEGDLLFTKIHTIEPCL